MVRISKCPDNFTVSTNPYDCEADVILPEPIIIDGCSDATYTINASAGTLILENGQYKLYGLPLGTHTVTIRAKDECLRTSQCTYEITVVDDVEPTAICDDELHVSIGGQGFARVFAEDVDEGSHDNCSAVTLEVRRLVTEDSLTCDPIQPFYTPWADYIDFNCCDVNDSVRIELRVTDIYGNSNVCWLDVLVEDKIRPFCAAPHAVDVDCDELPYDFDPENTGQLGDLFGLATGTDNCCGRYGLKSLRL